MTFCKRSKPPAAQPAGRPWLLQLARASCGASAAAIVAGVRVRAAAGATVGSAPRRRAGRAGPPWERSRPLPRPPAAQRQPDAVAAGAVLARAWIGAFAPAAVVAVRVVPVVAQAEEPDQPHDQQSDVEDPKADHEDPPLRGHGSMLARRVTRGKSLPAYFESFTVGFGSGT